MSKLAVKTALSVAADPVLPKLPNGCTWQDDGTVLMPLTRVVSLKGSTSEGENTVTVSELVFRELDAGDIIDSSNLPKAGSRTLFLLGASTGHSGPAGEKVLRKLSARDYIRATGVINVFTDDGPKVGTSS
ncbi:hypothetical protein [Gluconobacter frateurii]|uniref:Phage protein n=1 Tax=Gluconobacter frateurii NRIC 0228 TaxID=1307946 RepID=A0ABQ0Q940_9PROT|nr:hypothetical protein [Gluconobacter frateurii]GBR09512.1 hypothetical protein AA0228_0700 [Gluconobacter frateurii NRIC 0228]GLP91937.1 hypothetical protein GCM10007868_30120 [Gluconobacter frateurii]